MKLVYTSNAGVVELFGDGSGTFNITNIEGIDLISKSRALSGYADQDGMNEESAKYQNRTITVSCDAKCVNGNKSELKRAIKVLAQKGILNIIEGNSERIIEVSASTLTVGQRYYDYYPFVIQFDCDYPHFCDKNNTVVKLFSIVPKLSAISVFPCMFSQRTSQGTVNNNGDVNIYPIIEIENKENEQTTTSIVIENNTTNKQLTFSRNMQLGEKVTVDVKNRTVTSSVSGNIINTLSFYTSLADMMCVCGENELSVRLDGVVTGIDISIIYKNEYAEAI